jgi:tripartite-type tricarboxylate transporter receptor subunit TctC
MRVAPRILAIIGWALAGIAALNLASASAQTFPNRPLRLVVPYSAGGSTDLLGRLLAQHMGEALGQQIAVVNKPGGAAMIGAEDVARSPADGYSLLLATTAIGTNTVLYKTVPYTLASFAPVAPIAVTPNVLAINASLPVTTLAEFVAYAKARPGTLNYASLGRGGLTHLVSERFLSLAGLNIVEVNFPGAGPGQIALGGNHVQVFFDSIPSTLPLYQSGNTRILAITTEKRLAALPNVPTFAELGYPEMTKGGWYGILAPAGTPDPILQRLRAAVDGAQKLPAVLQRLTEMGAEPLSLSPDDFSRYIREDVAYWGEIARRLNIQLGN